MELLSILRKLLDARDAQGIILIGVDAIPEMDKTALEKSWPVTEKSVSSSSVRTLAKVLRQTCKWQKLKAAEIVITEVLGQARRDFSTVY
jgi:hypothetical protein